MPFSAFSRVHPDFGGRKSVRRGASWRGVLRSSVPSALFCSALFCVPLLSASASAAPRRAISGPAFASWSAMQVTGVPKAKFGTDDTSAWATALPDGGAEWIVAEIENPIALRGIRVVESFNPGAISRVVLLDDKDGETELWNGTDRTQAPGGIFQVKAAGHIARRVRIELDTSRVAGWNELDAIAFISAKGESTWATSAYASSAYGAPPSPFAPFFGRQVSVALDQGSKLRGRIVAVSGESLTLRTKNGAEILVLRERVLYVEKTSK